MFERLSGLIQRVTNRPYPPHVEYVVDPKIPDKMQQCFNFYKTYEQLLKELAAEKGISIDEAGNELYIMSQERNKKTSRCVDQGMSHNPGGMQCEVIVGAQQIDPSFLQRVENAPITVFDGEMLYYSITAENGKMKTACPGLDVPWKKKSSV